MFEAKQASDELKMKTFQAQSRTGVEFHSDRLEQPCLGLQLAASGVEDDNYMYIKMLAASGFDLT